MDIAIAVIKHPYDKKILIAQRRPDVVLANFWEFPGGKCLPGESLKDTVVRETREEVGLTVQVLEPWAMITHAYPAFTVKLHPFLCLADSVEVHPLDNQDVRWVSIHELPQYCFPEANGPLLNQIETSHIF